MHDRLFEAALGLTPPMLALIHFPSVVDMMCMKMDWTTELGLHTALFQQLADRLPVQLLAIKAQFEAKLAA